MTRPAVVTIGVFDGFHLGHRAVLNRARTRADEAAARCVVLTFGTHPRVILSQGGAPPLLTTAGEKAQLMHEAGADEVRVLQFSKQIAATGPEEFLRRHVFPFYRLAGLVVGYDFAMGKNRSGTAPVLAAFGERTGFIVEQVGPTLDGGRAASSTRIREALLDGDPSEAERLLGRSYRLTGTVVTGSARGRTIGVPTANVRLSAQKLLPAAGVYAVHVTGASLSKSLGVANLGVRPTVGGSHLALEVHVLDFQGDLVGRRLSVDFLEFLRPEAKFNNLSELAGAIQGDIRAARRGWGS